MIIKNFFNKNNLLSSKYYILFDKMFGIPDYFGPENAGNHFAEIIEKNISEVYKKNLVPIKILEVGAGKNSLFDNVLKEKYSLHITGLDISEEEMNHNLINDEAIIYDANNANYYKDLIKYKGKFDFVVSKMFLEHIDNPANIHRLINFCLKPKGKSIHFYPTLYEPAFILNKFLPLKLAKRLVELFDSSRKTIGVFPAYYRNCRALNKEFLNFYKSHGYKLQEEHLYYSTGYFKCFFPLYLFYLPLMVLCNRFKIKICSSYSLLCLRKVSDI